MGDPASMSPEEIVAYLNGPAAKPPDDELPDFSRIDNRNGLAVFVLTINIVVPSLFTLFYGYTRIFVYKDFVHSDVHFVLAYGLFIGYMAFLFKILNSFGMHVNQWDFRVREMPPFMADTFIAVILFILSAMFCKIAILLQWTRIFTPRGTRTDRKRKLMYWMSMFAIGFNVAYHIVAVLTVIIPCAPFETNEEQGAELFTCVPQIYFDFIESCLNVVLGIIIMFIPQQVIWSLQMPFREKLGISLLFAIGITAIGVACAKVAVTVLWFQDRGIIGDVDPARANSTYRLADQFYWIAAETALHILIYTLPATPKAMKSLGITKAFSSLGSVFSGTFGPLLSRSGGTSSSSQRGNGKLASAEADESGLIGLNNYSNSSRTNTSYGQQQIAKEKLSSQSMRTSQSVKSSYV